VGETLARLVALIASGDVSAAEDLRRELPAVPRWTAGEARRIRHACSTWSIDPARFGVIPLPPLDPELWPLRASMLLDPVPVYPTDADFQRAAMEASSHETEPAYAWRLEAIRWRRGHPGKPLDLGAIGVEAQKILALFARRAGGVAAS
jgi:hypothetical protein